MKAETNPPKPRILVVEDEGIVAHDIQQQLTELGYDPCGRATGAAQAIVLAGALRPALVLMDIGLAGRMDGIAATQPLPSFASALPPNAGQRWACCWPRRQRAACRCWSMTTRCRSAPATPSSTTWPQACLAVADTGMGMTEAQLASLFEPFNRLGREHSGVEGTGIGLAITKGLVEQMGGTLSVSSQANEGSCFTLRLPLSSAAVAAPPSATEPAAEPAVPRREPPALDVLCVKDNEINAYLLQELLQRLRPAWPGRCALQPPERRPRSCCARRRPAWCDWT